MAMIRKGKKLTTTLASVLHLLTVSFGITTFHPLLQPYNYLKDLTPDVFIFFCLHLKYLNSDQHVCICIRICNSIPKTKRKKTILGILVMTCPWKGDGYEIISNAKLCSDKVMPDKQFKDEVNKSN